MYIPKIKIIQKNSLILIFDNYFNGKYFVRPVWHHYKEDEIYIPVYGAGFTNLSSISNPERRKSLYPDKFSSPCDKKHRRYILNCMYEFTLKHFE